LAVRTAGVDQGLTAGDGEHEELRGFEAALERRSDEPSVEGATAATLEVRQHTVVVATLETLTADLGLADGRCHHGQVVHGTTSTRDRHVDSSVGRTRFVEFVLCDVTGLLLSFVEHLHDVLFEGFTWRTPWSGFVLLTVLAELLEFLGDTFLRQSVGSVDGIDGVLGEVLVVNTGGETKRRTSGDGKSGELVKETSALLRAVGLDDGVEETTVFSTDGSLVEGSVDLTVFDVDHVVGTASESQVDVVGDDQRDDVLATIGGFAVGALHEFWQRSGVADVPEHLQAVGLANHGTGSGQQVGAGDVVVDTTDDRTAVARGQDVLWTRIRILASARASSDWMTWRFISSPSKSAL
jgi:hypothetical protein